MSFRVKQALSGVNAKVSNRVEYMSENPIGFVGIPVNGTHYPNSVEMASSNDGNGQE